MIGIGVVFVHQLSTLDADVCRGWTVEERAERLPTNIWWLYMSTLTSQPILTKACTSAILLFLSCILSFVYNQQIMKYIVEIECNAFFYFNFLFSIMDWILLWRFIYV